jgi:hypothetical protein
MTAHETRPEMETTAGGRQGPETTGPMRAQNPEEAADRPMADADRPMADADRPVEPPVTENAAATSASNEQPAARTDSSDQMLFGDHERSEFHTRWTEVQSAFVDDPRDCVQKADALVSDVVDRLTAGFANARSGLEEQWSRGEQVSTEDLRIALQRYRDFFERLLAV